MRVLKLFVSWFSLFYLALYIPFTFMVYFSPWYRLNCRFHLICQHIEPEKANVYISELTGFFFHRDYLETDWSAKEKFHLNEVRSIFDALAVIAILSLGIFCFIFNKKNTRKFAGINILITLSMTIILPFFHYFWVSILHPLLFNNLAWKTNRLDVSYYLLPPGFFIYSLIFLIVISIIENITLWFCLREKK